MLAYNVVHRSEGSVTTNLFTLYPSTVSPEWKSSPGAGGQARALRESREASAT